MKINSRDFPIYYLLSQEEYGKLKKLTIEFQSVVIFVSLIAFLLILSRFRIDLIPKLRVSSIRLRTKQPEISRNETKVFVPSSKRVRGFTECYRNTNKRTYKVFTRRFIQIRCKKCQKLRSAFYSGTVP